MFEVIRVFRKTAKDL
jgi:hypothetical protein